MFIKPVYVSSFGSSSRLHASFVNARLHSGDYSTKNTVYFATKIDIYRPVSHWRSQRDLLSNLWNYFDTSLWQCAVNKTRTPNKIFRFACGLFTTCYLGKCFAMHRGLSLYLLWTIEVRISFWEIEMFTKKWLLSHAVLPRDRVSGSNQGLFNHICSFFSFDLSKLRTTSSDTVGSRSVSNQ